MDIKDSVVIITGGARGLGKTTAEHLLTHGAKIVLLDIDQEALETFGDHADVLKLNCDITSEEQIANAVKSTKDKFGRINVLINNAGILYSEPLLNIMSKERRHSLSSWQKVIDLNLTAPFVLTSYVAEDMVVTRTKGIIINISSISARGNAGQSAYSAAKAGLEALTKVWAKELGGFGIRSVAIAPGFMNTDSTHNAVQESELDTIKKKTALKKLGTAEEVSIAIKCVIENDYMTGNVIDINGGLVI